MTNKLGRSHLTGLVPPITLFVPWQVMRTLAGFCTGYGVLIKFVDSKKTHRKEKLFIFIENMQTAERLWSIKRFNGEKLLE